jgi:hypothetical protein
LKGSGWYVALGSWLCDLRDSSSGWGESSPQSRDLYSAVSAGAEGLSQISVMVQFRKTYHRGTEKDL